MWQLDGRKDEAAYKKEKEVEDDVHNEKEDV